MLTPEAIRDHSQRILTAGASYAKSLGRLEAHTLRTVIDAAHSASPLFARSDEAEGDMQVDLLRAKLLDLYERHALLSAKLAVDGDGLTAGVRGASLHDLGVEIDRVEAVLRRVIAEDL